jgi:hypothetical protein
MTSKPRNPKARFLTECFVAGQIDTVKNTVEARKKEKKEKTKRRKKAALG